MNPNQELEVDNEVFAQFDRQECEWCGAPATHIEQWDEPVPVCDKCGVPGVGQEP